MNDIQVILTRESDDGLYRLSDSNKKSADMRRRIEIINEVMPDVMVSIHQNSYHESEIRGAQVFYYQNSEKGKAFAQIMQKRFDFVLGEENRRAAKANSSYYLLTHSKPVSIIVEAGFLSNSREAALLETGGVSGPDCLDRSYGNPAVSVSVVKIKDPTKNCRIFPAVRAANGRAAGRIRQSLYEISSAALYCFKASAS